METHGHKRGVRPQRGGSAIKPSTLPDKLRLLKEALQPPYQHTAPLNPERFLQLFDYGHRYAGKISHSS